MKNQTIAALLITVAAFAGGNAFAADEGVAFSNASNFTSQVSRTDVQAAAQNAGSRTLVGDKDVVATFISTASSAAVHAEAVEYVRHPMLMIEKTGV